MRIAIFILLASLVSPSISRADDVPVLHIVHPQSSIKFYVKASVALAGKFDKWEGKLTFASDHVTSGVLDITIESHSVDTGSGMKNGKLKGDKFFDVKNNPSITFHSTRIVQTSPPLSKSTAISRFAVSPIPKDSPSLSPPIARASSTLTAKWSSTARTTAWTKASPSSKSPTTSKSPSTSPPKKSAALPSSSSPSSLQCRRLSVAQALLLALRYEGFTLRTEGPVRLYRATHETSPPRTNRSDTLCPCK